MPTYADGGVTPASTTPTECAVWCVSHGAGASQPHTKGVTSGAAGTRKHTRLPPSMSRYNEPSSRDFLEALMRTERIPRVLHLYAKPVQATPLALLSFPA